MKKIPFVHLHCHTEYSLLDGAARIEPLLQAAQEAGMPALAITDHGVMCGVVDFYRKAAKWGVKPILGCEVYVAPRSRFDRVHGVDDRLSHLVLLAENDEGYRNLMQLVSRAHLEGFYYKPRVDRELLEQYSRGLIALSACLAGQVPEALLRGDWSAARSAAGTLAEIFGRESFFLELQNHGLAEQQRVNPLLHKLAGELALPLVATNDLHYVKQQDAALQDVLLCIQTGKTLQDEDRTLRFAGDQFYLKSGGEMARSLPDWPQALSNTIRIAERCQVEMDFSSLHLPDFPVPAGYTPESYLRHLCRLGADRRYPTVTAEVEQRLEYELGVIVPMGFAGYFLIVQDFVNWARRRGIQVGPGRGSAAGSLVAFVLGITDLDPLRYGLLFERFLNPGRVSMPDIDIDFCYQRRDEVLEYIVQKYGSNRVAQIITFGTMMARAAIRDVGRVLGIPIPEVDRIAKLIPEELGITIKRALESSAELRRIYDGDERVRQLLATAQALEGMPRHASTHAAGVVIGKGELMQYVPLQKSGETVVTQFPKETVEEIGLLKMDILGLRTLTVMDEAVQAVGKREPGLALDRLELDDPATYELLSRGETIGIFQLESAGLRSLIRELKPNRFDDLVALVALYRPGPLGSGMVEDFIQRKHGLSQVVYPHPRLASILSDTYGVIVYQEQVMQIAHTLAGFSLAEADDLRRAMGKKKPEVLAAYRDRFLSGAIQLGVEEEVGHRVFSLMEYFAGYGFNRSHSAAYALIAYQTAYLKTHYPVEFMAALLSSVMSNTAKMAFYIEECRRMQIDVLPPDINESLERFTAVGGRIRFGLSGVKQVGEGAVAAILDARRDRIPFASLIDLCLRVDTRQVNRRVLENLIRAGAFSSLGVARSRLLQSLDRTMELVHRSQKMRSGGQGSLFDFGLTEEPLTADNLSDPDLPEFQPRELLEMEREVLGLYLSGSPLEEHRAQLAQSTTHTIAELQIETDAQPVIVGGLVAGVKRTVTKRGETMAYTTLEDTTGSIEVVVFPRIYQSVARHLQPGSVVIGRGRLQKQEETVRLLADSIEPLQEEKGKYKIFVKLPGMTSERELTEAITSILKEHPGNNQVYLHFAAEKKTILTHPEFWVALDPGLLIKIQLLLGEDSFSVRG